MSKPFPLSDGVRKEFQRHQAEADPVYRGLNLGTAPPPLDDERLPHYRQRLLKPIQQFSREWQRVDLPSNEDILNVAQPQILDAGRREITSPTNLKPGELREVVTVDQTGRKISTFHGDPENCWSPFKIPPRLVTGWRTK